MDAWALDELIGHFVNYRKQISPAMDDLLPVDQFSLYAVCTRHPEKLIRESKHNKLREIQTGVFDVQWGVRAIRLLVLNKMPAVDRNAIWQLFSSTPKGYIFGQQRYRWKMSDISNIIKMLYSREVLDMTYTVEDFQRDLPKELLTMLTDEQRSELVDNLSVDEMLNRLSPEERIRDLSPEERIRDLSPEERIRDLSPEERIRDLSPEERIRDLSPEEMLKHLSPEERIKDLSPKERQQMLDLLSSK